ncbi:lytic transglycosylase domain-containing protein [Vibrio aestuarianus subsp. cardii]|uniref:lytic transglycosylase domain-containing protein n=1 Tax=Vibrio aestuarianus TaxID=28171 RepID=UPI001559356A|nr:lytic transglycosylase domain-containing protein [Vibrio aestuarianus]NGZ66622.1 lytic transglycosylase domain-containing protein [Vibrio aestuarianus subsp. cardii]
MTVAQHITKVLILNVFVFISLHVNAYCFEEAGREFDVNVTLLKAICFTESSMRSNVINDANENGTTDFGLCQINSWWLSRLEPYGITAQTLLNDPCENTRVSAWILAQNFATSGETWLAIGAYNVGYEKTPKKDIARANYIALVKQNMERMSQ